MAAAAALFTRFMDWLERQGKPHPCPALPITPRILAQSFYKAMYVAGEGRLGDGMSREDFESCDAAEAALFDILLDYRNTAPQTVAEHQLGRALDHVARFYLEHRHANHQPRSCRR